MKLINFKTLEGQYIVLENGTELDIHNKFQLTNFKYSFHNRSFILTLDKRTDDWVQELDFKSLTLQFDKIDTLRIRESDFESLTNYPEDENTVSIIGLTTKDDTDFLGYIPDEAQDNQTEYALTIQTETEMAFVIHGESAELITE